MLRDASHPIARISDRRIHPLHAMLSAFPMAFFTAALVTDVVYWQTADMQWANFSVWLITAGLMTSVLAVLAGAIDLLRRGLGRAAQPAWPHVVGTLVGLALALLNAFVHSRDAYTSVVPTGLVLSALVVLALLLSGWLGNLVAGRAETGGFR